MQDIKVGSCVIVATVLSGIAPVKGARGIVGRIDPDGIVGLSLLGDDGQPFGCFWVPLACLVLATP